MQGSYLEHYKMKRIPFDELKIEDLWVDRDDDPFIKFPLLKLVGDEEKPFKLHPLKEYEPTDNHARGIKDTGIEKQEDLRLSLRLGWARGSYPIPFVIVDSKKRSFDRRHTISGGKKENLHNKNFPGAQYVRVPNKEWDWLSDDSVLDIAAILANVNSPVPADTKDHHFQHSVLCILHRDWKKEREPSNEEIRSILNLMGVRDRYPYDSTVKSIITKVQNDLNDDESVAHKATHSTNEDEVKMFVRDHEYFKENEETDSAIYWTKAIEKKWNFRYAGDILNKAFKAEDRRKKLILLLYCNRPQAKQVNDARKSIVEELKTQCDLAYNSYKRELNGILHEKMIPKKNVSNLDIEVWFKDQLEGETKPFRQSLD